MNSSSSIYVSHKLIKEIKDGLPEILNNDEELINSVMDYIKLKLRYNENKGSYNREYYEKYKKKYYEENKEVLNKRKVERARERRLEKKNILENSLNDLKI